MRVNGAPASFRLWPEDQPAGPRGDAKAYMSALWELDDGALIQVVAADMLMTVRELTMIETATDDRPPTDAELDELVRLSRRLRMLDYLGRTYRHLTPIDEFRP